MISFLVLAYGAPSVLAAFVAQFKGHPVSFYVHVDAKADAAAYRTAFAGLHASVFFVEDRLPIYWGGFNMIRATEILAKQALQDSATKVFSLVSDDALPLWSSDRCVRELLRQPNRFDAHPLAPTAAVRRRYEEFYYLDSPATSARWFPIEARVLSKVDEAALSRLALRRNEGKVAMAGLRAGSQWWSLERNVMQELLNILASDSALRESFEFSAIPDEMLFQTLAHGALGGSGYICGPMHVDFSREPKPFAFTGLPEGFVPLREKLFIRKVMAGAAAEMSSSIASGAWYE